MSQTQVWKAQTWVWANRTVVPKVQRRVFPAPGSVPKDFHTFSAIPGTPPAGRNLPSLRHKPQDPGRLPFPEAPEGRQTAAEHPLGKICRPYGLVDLSRAPTWVVDNLTLGKFRPAGRVTLGIQG